MTVSLTISNPVTGQSEKMDDEVMWSQILIRLRPPMTMCVSSVNEGQQDSREEILVLFIVVY